jgi:hypothetical protein
MRLQRHLMRSMGMLQGLSGLLMPNQVILLPMPFSGRSMSMCRQIVQFSSFPVGIAHIFSVYERFSIRYDLL